MKPSCEFFSGFQVKHMYRDVHFCHLHPSKFFSFIYLHGRNCHVSYVELDTSVLIPSYLNMGLSSNLALYFYLWNSHNTVSYPYIILHRLPIYYVHGMELAIHTSSYLAVVFIKFQNTYIYYITTSTFYNVLSGNQKPPTAHFLSILEICGRSIRHFVGERLK